MESFEKPAENLDDSLLTTLSKEEADGLIEYIRKAFNTDEDPNQAPPSMEQFMAIYKIDPYALLVKKDKNGNIMGWSGIVPTRSELAQQFVQGKIHEDRVIEKAIENPGYDSAYFWASYMKPEYRQKGAMLEFKKAQFKELQKRHPEMKRFYGYAYSPEGSHLLERYEKSFGIKIEKPDYSLKPEDNPKSPEYEAARKLRD